MNPLALTFATPLAFLALLALPILAALYIWRLRKPRRDVIRFPAAATLASVIPTRRSNFLRHLPALLLAVALVGLTVAWAKPEATVTVADQQASVMLVIDGSGSMAATDVEPSRLEAVRGAAKQFVDQVPEDLRVGAMSFERTPTAVTRPTTDHDTVTELLDDLIANGGTGTGDALRQTLDILRPRGEKDKNKPAAVLLLSDGRTTSGTNPVEQARRARDLGVPIYTVALGTDTGTVPGGTGAPLPVPPDPDTMRRIADISKGRFYQVDDASRLEEIYSRLGKQIGSHEEQREVSVWFAAMALAALLAALALSARRQPVLP